MPRLLNLGLLALFFPLAINYTPFAISSGLQDDMLLIPAGEFLMGSPAGGEAFSDESPQRNVFVSAFWMDRTEVTNIAYARFVEATGHRPPVNDNPRVTLWPHGVPLPAIARHPVINVSWHDAMAYCRWRGTRLPTEAEWEKAARGTDGRRYPWGNEWDTSKANSAGYWAGKTINFDSIEEFNGFWKTGEGARLSREQGINGEVLTTPAGSFPQGASPYGLLDMAGNVAEWVSDWYEPYSYLTAPLSDPQGPNGKLLKGLRGGSWLKGERSLRTSDRDYGLPDDRPSGAGFRCAKDAW